MIFPQPDPGRAALYRAAGQWRDDTIPGLIAAATQATPDKIAVRDASGIALSFRDLDDRVARLAGHLHSKGIGRGDIVTVCLPNWWQTVVTFLAIMRVGAVVNPIPPTYGRADLGFVLGKCASKALFIPGHFRSTDFTAEVVALDPHLAEKLLLVRVGDGREEVGHTFEATLGAAPIASEPEIAADAAVAVLFTSGTESRPKGAVHTHNTILYGERALSGALGLGADDVAFMASPIAHTTGFMHGVVLTLTSGATLSLLDIFEGKVAADQMRAHRCSWTMGATPFLVEIAAALAANDARLPDLRYFLCGGAPIPEAAVKRSSEVGLRVMSIYGSTESPPHTVVHPEDPLSHSWETDGRPVEGIAVRMVGPDGDDVPHGEIGEEWSRGPNTFLGYLGDPELTRRDFDADGWYHSGDLARMLPDGSIRVSGRLKEIIVRGGQNISVREIEDYLAAHPAIHRAAVVGIPHLKLGETSCAVVATKPGATLTLAELVEFLLAKGIAKFKLPERLEIWPNLPSTPSGKIQKFVIRKALGERPGEDIL